MRAPHLAIARSTCDTARHELIVGGEAMANEMLDARQEGDSYRRIEVITGKRRRRRWTAVEKARIVAESFEEGANISEVARRHHHGGPGHPQHHAADHQRDPDGVLDCANICARCAVADALACRVRHC